jgi:hypothetical protein
MKNCLQQLFAERGQILQTPYVSVFSKEGLYSYRDTHLIYKKFCKEIMNTLTENYFFKICIQTNTFKDSKIIFSPLKVFDDYSNFWSMLLQDM